MKHLRFFNSHYCMDYVFRTARCQFKRSEISKNFKATQEHIFNPRTKSLIFSFFWLASASLEYYDDTLFLLIDILNRRSSAVYGTILLQMYRS